MLNSRFNDEGTKKRFEEEYDKYPTFIIGVDFDNTIRYLDGSPCMTIIALLQELSKLPKIVLCLWSICQSTENIQEKLDYCRAHNIDIKYVNDSPIKYGDNRKAFFNALLDDRAGLESMYKCLTNLVLYANNKPDSATAEFHPV